MRGPTPQKPRSCPASARVDPYAARRASPSTALSAADQSGVLAIARSSAGDGGDSTSTLVRPSFAQYTSWTTTRSGRRHHLPALLKQVAAGYCPLLMSTLQLTVQPARRDAAAGEEMVSVQSPGGPGTRPSREADEHRVHSHHREGQQRPAERGERWQPTPPAADDASAAQHQREEQHR